MNAVYFVIFLATMFVVMSIFLFNGKGAWLIAGYNTASPQEKEKFNEKKLCKCMSVIMAVVAALLYIMAYLAYRVEAGIMDENNMLPFALIFIGVVLAMIIFGSIYINKYCKK